MKTPAEVASLLAQRLLIDLHKRKMVIFRGVAFQATLKRVIEVRNIQSLEDMDEV
jgi:hypothetical protein